MARMSAEACMFCGETPCGCNAEKPKAKAPRIKPTPPIEPPAKPPVEPEVVVPERKKFVMRSLPPAVAQPTRVALQQTSQVQEAAQQVADGEGQLRRALTAFVEGGLVCADEILKFKDLLDIDPERIRVIAWKQRRLEWQMQFPPPHSPPAADHSRMQ